MTDPTTNSADPADGPGGPAEDPHSTEWAFDLDDALISGNGRAHSDDTRNDAPGISLEPGLDIQADGSAAIGPDDRAPSGGTVIPTTLSESVLLIDGAFNTDLEASPDNAVIGAKTVFYADSLIFEEDSLIG